MSTDAEERALVDLIRRGDQSAWTDLLSRYQDRLFSICYRLVGNRDAAADMTQDAFVKIIEGLPSYDGRAKLSTWIYRITMNSCLSRLRSEKYRRHASLDAPAGPHDPGGSSPGAPRIASVEGREPSAAVRVQQREDRERVWAALLNLPAQQRAILLLRDTRGLEYDQIAEVLGVPIGTVKSRLFRAREALRHELERDSEG